MRGFQLPSRIEGLLAIASQQFANQGESDHVKIITNARIEIAEGVTDDDWSDGRYGHQIDLCLPPPLAHFALDETIDYAGEICSVLRRLTKVPKEFIASVHLCADHTAVSKDWRRETGALLTAPTLESPDQEDETRIWKGYALRVFLSHRAEFKVEANSLRDCFAERKIGAFVAHEDIEPNRKWQTEIEKALDSMDVLVAMHSQGFSESLWTNQEVGIALGRGIPVVSLRLDEDPKGFVGATQAVSGRGKTTDKRTAELTGCFCKIPNLAFKLRAVILQRWETSNSFDESKRIMDDLEALGQLTANELAQAERAFASNDQLYRCRLVNKHYPEWLKRQKAGLR